MNQKKYYPTAVALYITYFILGIAVTIMGQYKQSFAAMWGANQLADGSFDVSKVMAIIAAVGLGRLIAFPFAGPFSDKYGRRLSALVGVVFFAIFFIGITFTHSTVLAYILIFAAAWQTPFWIQASRPPAWKSSRKTVRLQTCLQNSQFLWHSSCCHF